MNKWQEHLKKVREENKELPQKEVMKKASETFKKDDKKN